MVRLTEASNEPTCLMTWEAVGESRRFGRERCQEAALNGHVLKRISWALRRWRQLRMRWRQWWWQRRRLARVRVLRVR